MKSKKQKTQNPLALIQSRIQDLLDQPQDAASFPLSSNSQSIPSPEMQAIASRIGNTSNTLPSQNGSGADPIALIQKYFPKNQWDNAIAVMRAESGGNPQAIGDNYPINGETIPSVGLFQIRTLPGRPSPQALMDPEQNVAYAAQMQQEQGWQPWSTARSMGLPGTTPLPSAP